jgi:hypothetical protein
MNIRRRISTSNIKALTPAFRLLIASGFTGISNWTNTSRGYGNGGKAIKLN